MNGFYRTSISVLICKTNSILNLGILSALSGKGITLYQTVTTDIGQLLKEEEIYHPNVVILSQESMIVQHPHYCQLLTRNSAVRVLTVCAASNHVCIDQDRVAVIHKASDIIDLIVDDTALTIDWIQKGDL